MLPVTSRPDVPAPMRRRGPRPLGLHLTLATSNSSASASASPNWSAGAPDAAFVRGIAAYRRHPYQRDVADPPPIWADGTTRLLDYGGRGPTIVVVPSLINRAYVLDLAAGRSMLRFLAAHGLHVLLLDWGWPDTLERTFSMTDYVVGRLERALESLPGPVMLAGYCMGGLLSLAAAQRRPDLVQRLLLLATPWDFHAADPSVAASASLALLQSEPLMARGTLPVDALQALFTLQDVHRTMAKYREFASLDPASERARMFVAIEDWLSDGVPLPAIVARECLDGWYVKNRPGRGEWQIAGRLVRPSEVQMPALIALPEQDRIVPPESAAALLPHVPHAAVLRPAAGHIGMIAGSRAEQALWRPALDWMLRA